MKLNNPFEPNKGGNYIFLIITDIIIIFNLPYQPSQEVSHHLLLKYQTSIHISTITVSSQKAILLRYKASEYYKWTSTKTDYCEYTQGFYTNPSLHSLINYDTYSCKVSKYQECKNPKTNCYKHAGPSHTNPCQQSHHQLSLLSQSLQVPQISKQHYKLVFPQRKASQYVDVCMYTHYIYLLLHFFRGCTAAKAAVSSLKQEAGFSSTIEQYIQKKA